MKLGWVGLIYLEAERESEHFCGTCPQEQSTMINEGIEVSRE